MSDKKSEAEIVKQNMKLIQGIMDENTSANHRKSLVKRIARPKTTDDLTEHGVGGIRRAAKIKQSLKKHMEEEKKKMPKTLVQDEEGA